MDFNQPTSPLNPNKAPVVFKQLKTRKLMPSSDLMDLSSVKKPFPTNKWWQNLVLGKGDNPLHPYPYVVYCNTTGASVGMPKFTSTSKSVTSSMVKHWTLTSNGLAQRQVTDYDDLGVEVTWTGSNSKEKMRARYYKGLPFVSYEFVNGSPVLSTVMAILDVKPLATTVNTEGTNSAASVRRMARAMAERPGMARVSLNDGSQWLVVSKPPIDWQQSKGQLVAKGGAFNGVVQLAHLGDKPDANINTLQAYAGTYPVSASVSYGKIETASGRSSAITYIYQASTNSNGKLLTMVLPHHVETLDKSVQKPALTGYRCIKGEMTAVDGNAVTYTQPLQDAVTFEGPRQLSQQDTQRIKEQLAKDSAGVKVTAPDPYFFGKGVAKIARLMQIAKEVSDDTTANALSDKLVGLLKPWLISQDNSDPLLYDVSWGGIITQKGANDPAADFGQGYYNDHHFHYGYFLYAAAILAKHEPSKFAPFKDAFSQLLRDYANPSKQDPELPHMRHFDPYDGHSWAAGLFEFGDGRNQESTGEAVNAYYSAMLYARAMGLTEAADFYEIVLNMEAHSGRQYWHPTLEQSKQQYGDGYQRSIVGILWSSKLDFATFFGAKPQYIYGIQMIPFTPATPLLLTKEWVSQAWTQSPHDTMESAAKAAGKDGWAQFLYTAYSLVNRKEAEPNALQCTPDDGNTLTNILHWIANYGS